MSNTGDYSLLSALLNMHVAHLPSCFLNGA